MSSDAQSILGNNEKAATGIDAIMAGRVRGSFSVRTSKYWFIKIFYIEIYCFLSLLSLWTSGMHLLPYAHCVATALVCTPPSSLPSCPMCCSQTENGNIRYSALKFNDRNKSTDPRQRLKRLLSVASLSRKYVRACQAFFFGADVCYHQKCACVCILLQFIAITVCTIFFFGGFSFVNCRCCITRATMLVHCPLSLHSEASWTQKRWFFLFFFLLLCTSK